MEVDILTAARRLGDVRWQCLVAPIPETLLPDEGVNSAPCRLSRWELG